MNKSRMRSIRRFNLFVIAFVILGIIVFQGTTAHAFQSTGSPSRAFCNKLGCSEPTNRKSSVAHGSRLFMAESKKSSSARSSGVYVRPSGAIEKGSGFFVPGLEGPRVRVLFGTVLLVLTGANHLLAGDLLSNGGLSLEEAIAIGYSLLVLFQAAIEYGKEELIVESTTTATTAKNRGADATATGSKKDLVQEWRAAESLSDSFQDAVQWAAASYLSVTPATQLLLLEGDSILYRLSGDTSSTSDPEAIASGVEAALDQLRQSKGGRLALPPTHPAVKGLGLQEARTVVLQRITDRLCFVMSSSDQLLAGFTTEDLKWLGQMAGYVRSSTA